jgi:hypothetical protein
MSRAFKCDDCGQLVEGDPSKNSVPVKRGEKVYAYLDFTTDQDLCAGCTAKVLSAAIEAMKEAGAGKGADIG